MFSHFVLSAVFLIASKFIEYGEAVTVRTAGSLGFH